MVSNLRDTRQGSPTPCVHCSLHCCFLHFVQGVKSMVAHEGKISMPSMGVCKTNLQTSSIQLHEKKQCSSVSNKERPENFMHRESSVCITCRYLDFSKCAKPLATKKIKFDLHIHQLKLQVSTDVLRSSTEAIPVAQFMSQSFSFFFFW